MTDNSTDGPDTGPGDTTDDAEAPTPRPSSDSGPERTKPPSIWPEPIAPPQRPDLWSPEARLSGPIPTATTPLTADAADGDEPVDDEPSDESVDEPAESAGASSTDASAPADEPAAGPPATGDGSLTYTGLFKKISDEDLAAADQADASVEHHGVDGHGDDSSDDDDAGAVAEPTAPFDVPASFAAEAVADSQEGDDVLGPEASEGAGSDSHVAAADGADAGGVHSGPQGHADGVPAVPPPPDPPGGGPPSEEQPSAQPGRRGRRAVIIAAAVVGVLAIGYGVAYAVAGGTLARGATVAGIDIGGMTREEAHDALSEQLPGIVDTPMSITVDNDDATYELVPSSVGLTVDVEATLDQVPGGTASPVSLVRALMGTDATQPVATVDEEQVSTAVADIASQSDSDPVNGSVAFEDGEVVTSEPVAGRALDTEAAVTALTEAFYGENSDGDTPTTSVTFPSAEVRPTIDTQAVETAVAEFAEPAMSGPVTVAADGESVDLEPATIGSALSMSANDDGVLQPSLDPDALAEAAEDELEELGQEGQDASIVIENGEPTIIEAEAGQTIAPDALSEAVLPALTASSDDREVEVELTESEPEVTTEAAEELGVTEVVSEFTTNFPEARYRDVNIGTAAASIDNVLLLPGDEFSLNDIVGERTEANGYTSGTIISGGRLEDAMGGGVSQVATTAFHAAFQAGLEDVEHWPHSIYFDRYPIGQEATVAWGAKDMRFKNDTEYGVLVDTAFTPSQGNGQGSLTVRIWSTQHLDVETSVSDRYSPTSPQTIYDTSDECAPQGGSNGFSIDSYRTVTLPDGTVDKDETTSWTYNPNHRVVCGPEPDDG